MSTAPQEPSEAMHPHEGAAPPPPPRTTAMQLDSDRRNWGVAAHLSTFVGAWVALAFIGPLLVWLLKKDEDSFVGHHAREALNFNLTLLLGGVVAGALTFVVAVLTLGLGLLVLLPLGLLVILPVFAVWVWCTINGAMHASRGEAYHYPLTVRMVR